MSLQINRGLLLELSAAKVWVCSLKSWGLGFFFSTAYGSNEILRFLSESHKHAVVTVIVPLENAEVLLALQCASSLFYSKTHSDLLELDIIGAISVSDWLPCLTCVEMAVQLLTANWGVWIQIYKIRTVSSPLEKRTSLHWSVEGPFGSEFSYSGLK